MKQKILYTCEICGTSYNTPGDARFCEKTHVTLKGAKITPKYKPVTMIASGMPYAIEIKYADGTVRTYR